MKLFKMKKNAMNSKLEAQSCDEAPMLQFDGSRPLEGTCPPPPPLPHTAPLPPHMSPAPPHFRNAKIHVDFDDEDLQILPLIFGNEGDAYAIAESIVADAPDEMRVQFIQLLSVIKTVLSHIDSNTIHTETSEASDAHIDAMRQKLRKGCSRYPSPGLGSGAEELFEKLYNDKALEFLEALWKAPKEPPIISRMIAYLSDLCQKGA